MTTPFRPEHETEHFEPKEGASVFDDQSDAPPVGHSGNLPKEMRETPREEFGPIDNAKDATGNSVLTTPDDPSTMVEYVTEDYERPAAELDPNHPENITTKKPSLLKKAVLGAALVGGGALAALGVTEFVSGEDEPQADPTEVSTDGTVDEDDGFLSSETTTTLAPLGEYENGERITNPVPLTALDPQELFNQYAHNEMCFLQNESPQIQEECADALFSDSAANLRGELDNLRDDIALVKAEDPNYLFQLTGDIQPDLSGIVIDEHFKSESIAAVVVTGYTNGRVIDKPLHIEFVVDDIDNNGNIIWRVKKYGPLDPSTYTPPQYR